MSLIKDPIAHNHLVLLPGIILVILQWILRYLLPAIAPKAAAIGYLGGIACGLAIAVWWLFFSHAARIERWGAIILIIVFMTGIWPLLRTNGMTGEGRHYLDWRWARTKEEMLLAQDSNGDVLSLSGIAAVETMAEWPGFRGANRDGIVKGIKISNDWAALPPEEICRKPAGPGCSSFAVKGDRLMHWEHLIYMSKQKVTNSGFVWSIYYGPI